MLLIFQWSYVYNKFSSQNPDIHTSSLGEPKDPGDGGVGPSPWKMLSHQYYIVGGRCLTAGLGFDPQCLFARSLYVFGAAVWRCNIQKENEKKLHTDKRNAVRLPNRAPLSLKSQAQWPHELSDPGWFGLTSSTRCIFVVNYVLKHSQTKEKKRFNWQRSSRNYHTASHLLFPNWQSHLFVFSEWLATASCRSRSCCSFIGLAVMRNNPIWRKNSLFYDDLFFLVLPEMQSWWSNA